MKLMVIKVEVGIKKIEKPKDELDSFVEWNYSIERWASANVYIGIDYKKWGEVEFSDKADDARKQVVAYVKSLLSDRTIKVPFDFADVYLEVDDSWEEDSDTDKYWFDFDLQ